MKLLSFAEFAEKLRGALLVAAAEQRTLLIATHISPDPDAIGSAFALAALAREIGVAAQVYLPEALPQKYTPLISDIPFVNRPPEAFSGPLAIVDTATKKRVGEELYPLIERFTPTFNLDHHVSNEGWAEWNHVDGKAAASAVLVARLFSELQAPMSKTAANLLYAGVLDDTGSFCFSNTTGPALRLAAELVENGANPEDIASTLYFSVPERILRLQARALQSLRLCLDGKVSLLVVNRSVLEETGCSAEDTEGLVDIARKVDGSLVAVFLRELEGKWKASFRSKVPTVDVNRVAAEFGGGGHTAAAGATLSGNLPEIEARILAAVERALLNTVRRPS